MVGELAVAASLNMSALKDQDLRFGENKPENPFQTRKYLQTSATQLRRS